MLVVEAFVPDDPPREGSVVEVRSMTTSEVVLSVSTHDPTRQRAEGHFVHLADGAPVRLRPWSIRYAPLAELDAMAAAAGLTLARSMGGLRAATVRRREPAPRERVRPIRGRRTMTGRRDTTVVVWSSL